MSAVRVDSIEEEEAAIGVCHCGSARRATVSEEMLPIRSRWYDSLVLRCQHCGSFVARVFDVTSFYEPRPGIWRG
jgi:hypothetical protein